MKLKDLIPLKEQRDSVSPLILKKVNVFVDGEKTDVSIRYNPYKDLQDVIISWGEESHTVDFDAEDVIDDHGNEGKDMSFVAFSKDDYWRFIVDVSVEASYDMSGNIQEIMWDTLEIDVDDAKQNPAVRSDSDDPIMEKNNKMKKSQLRNIIRKSIKELLDNPQTEQPLDEADLRKYYCYKCKGGFFKGSCVHNASILAPHGQRPGDCQSKADCEASCTRSGGKYRGVDIAKSK